MEGFAMLDFICVFYPYFSQSLMIIWVINKKNPNHGANYTAFLRSSSLVEQVLSVLINLSHYSCTVSGTPEAGENLKL